MRFYNEQHAQCCGIDLHAKTMYVCILDRDGQVLANENLYEIHDVKRFERVQQFASYARLVKCAKESARRSSAAAAPRWATFT